MKKIIDFFKHNKKLVCGVAAAVGFGSLGVGAAGICAMVLGIGLGAAALATLQSEKVERPGILYKHPGIIGAIGGTLVSGALLLSTFSDPSLQRILLNKQTFPRLRVEAVTQRKTAEEEGNYSVYPMVGWSKKTYPYKAEVVVLDVDGEYVKTLEVLDNRNLGPERVYTLGSKKWPHAQVEVLAPVQK